MSLGAIFERIDADVAAKITALASVPELAGNLIGDLFYIPGIHYHKVLLLHLLSQAQQVRTPTDVTQMAELVRRIVACAASSTMSMVILEQKYLARFG